MRVSKEESPRGTKGWLLGLFLGGRGAEGEGVDEDGRRGGGRGRDQGTSHIAAHRVNQGVCQAVGAAN